MATSAVTKFVTDNLNILPTGLKRFAKVEFQKSRRVKFVAIGILTRLSVISLK